MPEPTANPTLTETARQSGPRCARCGSAAANGPCDQWDCDRSFDPKAHMLDRAALDAGDISRSEYERRWSPWIEAIGGQVAELVRFSAHAAATALFVAPFVLLFARA